MIVKLNPLDKDRIKGGDIACLYAHLVAQDEAIVRKLKATVDQTRFYQGSSAMVDYILEILK